MISYSLNAPLCSKWNTFYKMVRVAKWWWCKRAWNKQEDNELTIFYTFLNSSHFIGCLFSLLLLLWFYTACFKKSYSVFCSDLMQKEGLKQKRTPSSLLMMTKPVLIPFLANIAKRQIIITRRFILQIEFAIATFMLYLLFLHILFFSFVFNRYSIFSEAKILQ